MNNFQLTTQDFHAHRPSTREMMDIAIANAITRQGGVTMTSREIAELVNSRHDKVKQSIERLVERNIIAQPPMGDVQEVKGNNRFYTTTEYIFTGEQGKRDSIIVVAQLCPEFTARLVDRWQELEALIRDPSRLLISCLILVMCWDVP